SNFVTQQIRQAFPELADRCGTLYNGVDVNSFTPPPQALEEPGPKRLLYVGAVSPHKGLHILLDALPEVIKRYPNSQLEIVGERSFMLPLDWLPTLGEPAIMETLLRFYDGKGYGQHLKEQIFRLNLSQYVHFSGKVARHELAQHYRKSDLFVFP